MHMMKKYWWILAGIVILGIGFFSMTSKPEVKKQPVMEAGNGDGIHWLSYEEAVKANKKKKKKYLVDVYTSWCGWCKVMDKQTFSDPTIAKYINEKFIPVKLNAERDTFTVYQGEKVKEPFLAGRIFRASGYPTTVFLGENESVLHSQAGFLDPSAMGALLHYYGDNAYKTMSWDQFKSTYGK